jgi:hypothetical protein
MWMEKATQNFDVLYNTALKGKVSLDRKTASPRRGRDGGKERKGCMHRLWNFQTLEVV